MTDNVVQIDTIRIERNEPRKCVCDHRKYKIDTVNREISCGCGIIHDPFEAMLDLARNWERANEQQVRMRDQFEQWKKEKPYSVIFKNLEQHYQRGKMLPSCPECEKTFDFKDVTFWTNAEFYRKLKARAEGDYSTE